MQTRRSSIIPEGLVVGQDGRYGAQGTLRKLRCAAFFAAAGKVFA